MSNSDNLPFSRLSEEFEVDYKQSPVKTKDDEVFGFLDSKPKQEIMAPKSNKGMRKDRTREVEDDYEYTRKKLRSIMDTAEDALDRASSVSAEIDDPKIFTAIAQLVKSISGSTESLGRAAIDRKEALEYDDSGEEDEGGKTVNNTIVFNGTNSDLLDQIGEQLKEQRKRQSAG